MKLDLVLSGVGGQGILTIATFLDYAAIAKNFHFKQAEVHGMSQRGGAVYSNLRISSEPIMSDLIPEGRADMILSLEPLEVARYLNYLKPTGFVVANSAPVKNIPDYPQEDSIYSFLFKLGNVLLVDAKAIATKAGVPMAQNVALLGVAMPFLPFETSDFLPVIQKLFERKGEKVVKGNTQVLELGLKVGLLYKQLLDHKVAPALCYSLMSKLDVSTIDPSLGEHLAKILNANATGALAALAKVGQEIACTKEALSFLT